MEDQRRDIRVKALLGAVVGLVEGNEKIPCQVRNISETGAGFCCRMGMLCHLNLF